MPYISQHRKAELELALEGFLRDGVLSEGELNFVITTICLNYVQQRVLGYSVINTAIGALECAKLEMYRRLAAPHEDYKKSQNGDVYPTLNLPGAD